MVTAHEMEGCTTPQPEATPTVKEDMLKVEEAEQGALKPETALTNPALEPLRKILTCPLCGNICIEATTSVKCGHTFCYLCISERVNPEAHNNMCPACTQEGRRHDFGHRPFGVFKRAMRRTDDQWGAHLFEVVKQHESLKYDVTMDTLIKKLFPRPDIDRQAEARRLSRLRMEVQAAGGPAAAIAGARPQGPYLSIPTLPDVPALAVCLQPHHAPGQTLPMLHRPHMLAQAGLTLLEIQQYIAAMMEGLCETELEPEDVQLALNGNVYPSDTTVHSLFTGVWAPDSPNDDIMLLHYYRAKQSSQAEGDWGSPEPAST